ncbi:hypothetical protein [Dactylosporangium sp. CA-139066]|uniref:hypothetical protein n=1 Tax=Dactylosporangium sp. CA-139066 TaxID=3239930 RepID=UPI003D89E088
MVSALPWQAAVTMTGAPRDKLTATYTTTAPTFTPDATSRQSIAVAAWPNTAPLALNLQRVQPTASDYKGTLRLQRPDGTTVDATVSLVWTPGTKTLQGSYKSATGAGGLQITFTAP